jgi:VWA domain containing CoxE-like protein
MQTVPVHAVRGGGLACTLPDVVFDEQSNGGGGEDAISDLVFLVDSSGSMCTVWPYVARGVNAVCASRPRTHVLKWANYGTIRQAKLEENQSECAVKDRPEETGFGTNITQAAVVLEKFLQPLLKDGPRTVFVVFVSDGEGWTEGLEETCASIRTELVDKTGSTLEMTTLGIGGGFPTHVAMTIRNALHNGRSNVPLVSIVEESADFPEALDGLSAFMAPRCTRLRLVEPCAARVAPWADESETAQVGVSLLLPAGTARLVVAQDDGGKRRVSGRASESCVALDIELTPWTEASLSNFAKQMTWQLQAMSLKRSVAPDVVRSRALSAFEIVTAAAAEVSAVDSAQSAAQCGQDAGTTVFNRAERKRASTSRFVLDALRKELRMLAEGSPLDELTDADLKQRLAIGTMEGKFHQKAISYKGLSTDDFRERADEFVKLLGDRDLMDAVAAAADVEETAGLRSAVSLERNSDVWREPQLADAISNHVATQYALVECLPLVGLAVNVLRSSASMINPWAARVGSMSQLTPVLDSVSLLAIDAGAAAVGNAGVKAWMNTGDDEREVVNAVCSVVASRDHAAAARPFLTSRMYHVLHTYSACGNADTSDASSHPALLAAVLCYMLDQNYAGVAAESSWRRMVTLTLRELYPRLGVHGGGFVAALLANSATAVVTENPALTTKCQSVSKPVALCLAWKAAIPKTAARRIFHSIVKEWVGRAIGQRRELSDWFRLSGDNSCVVESQSGDEVTPEKIVARMPIVSYFTTVEAVAALPEFTRSAKMRVAYAGLEFDPTQSIKSVCRDGAVSFQTLVQFGRAFLDRPGPDAEIISDDDLKRYTLHAIRHNSSYDRSQAEPASDWSDDLVAKELVCGVKRRALAKLRSDIPAAVKDAWRAEMGKTHGHDTIPMTFAAITQVRAKRGFKSASEAELGYRADVGLCRNACMSAACPFFLELRGGTTPLHYSEADASVVTAFSIAVSSCVRAGKTDPHVILQAVKSGEYMQYEDEARRAAVEEALGDPTRWAVELKAVEALVPVYQKLARANKA